jgi:hypothetical protein
VRVFAWPVTWSWRGTGTCLPSNDKEPHRRGLLWIYSRSLSTLNGCSGAGVAGSSPMEWPRTVRLVTLSLHVLTIASIALATEPVSPRPEAQFHPNHRLRKVNQKLLAKRSWKGLAKTLLHRLRQCLRSRRLNLLLRRMESLPRKPLSSCSRSRKS